ncbi:MAG: cysteine desulfurase family protein [Candidatus Shapirobacteria bacterium]
MKKTIYLDNAATTPVTEEVVKAMLPYFTAQYGNASEFHYWGQQARAAIETSRATLADFLGAKPEEIIFTSGATESINLAHKGLIEGLKVQKFKNSPHIITSQIEHKAVLETCKHLEKLGWATVTYLPVDQYGLINLSDLEKAIKPETVLASIMYVNNEVGTIEPLIEIGQLLKKMDHKIYFHTDATQAIQCLDCNIDRLGVDLLSLTGHKFGAPKGVGALYVRRGTPLVRQQDGGSQESGLRAGTENVPYIVALGKATDLISKLRILRDELISGVLKISGVKLTGHPVKRAPHVASFVVDGVEGEAILLHLSDAGVAASTGSACNSSNLEASHVLKAMGLSEETSHGSLRLSLGPQTTKKEIDYVLEILPKIISDLRRMAPKNV